MRTFYNGHELCTDQDDFDAMFRVAISPRGRQISFTEHNTAHGAKDDNGEPAQSECWLESIDDAPFKITVFFPEMDDSHPFSDSDWRCDAYVDGRKLSGGVLELGDNVTHFWSMELRDEERDCLVEHELKFAKMNTTSDPALAHINEESAHALGTIVIDLQPGTWSRSTKPSQYSDRAVMPSVGTVYDGGRKMKHGQIIEPGKTIGDVDLEECTWYDFESATDEIFHRFVYRYRSKRALQLMGIIPRPKRKRIQRTPQSEDEDEGSSGAPDSSSLRVRPCLVSSGARCGSMAGTGMGIKEMEGEAEVARQRLAGMAIEA